jgi:cytochrome bd-type quinol oxidase subunit 2
VTDKGDQGRKPSRREVGAVLAVSATAFGIIGAFIQVQTELPKLWKMWAAVLTIVLAAVVYLWRHQLRQGIPQHRRGPAVAGFVMSLAVLFSLLLLIGHEAFRAPDPLPSATPPLASPADTQDQPEQEVWAGREDDVCRLTRGGR